MSLCSSLGSSSGTACGFVGPLGLGWQPPEDHGCSSVCSSFSPGSSQDGPEKGQGIGPGLLKAADLTPPDRSGLWGSWRVAMYLESLRSQILKWRENALSKESFVSATGKRLPGHQPFLHISTDPSSSWWWLPQPPHLLL